MKISSYQSLNGSHFLWTHKSGIDSSKGQLISEWLFSVLNFQNKTQKIDEFLPIQLIGGYIISMKKAFNCLI